MRKFILSLVVILLFSSVLMAASQKVAILSIQKNDRESDYVVKAMTSRDFKMVFKDSEDLELIDMKASDKVFKASGYENLDFAGKEEIAKMGTELNADVVVWGTVSSISSSEFKFSANIFSMKSEDVVATTFTITKDGKSRRNAVKENLVAKIEEFSGGEVEKLMGIAMGHFNSRNFTAAEETFQSLLEIDPENIEAYFYIGFINFIEFKNYEKSKEYYLKGLEVDPTNKNLLDYLSKTYMAMGEPEEAAEALMKITDTEDNKEIWLRIGNIYSDIEYYDEAQEAFEKAIELDENYGEAYAALGDLFYSQELYDDAIEPLENAAKILPEDDDIQQKLAKCYKNTGRLDSAIQQYKEVIAEQPNNTKAYMNLANAYISTEQYQEALETALKLKEIAPQDPKSLILVANSYYFLKNYTSAENTAKQAMELDNELFQPYRIMADIYFDLGYKKYETFLQLEEKAKEAYGAEADKLTDERDKAKTDGNNLLQKSESYLNEAKKRAKTNSDVKYVKGRSEILKQLLEATKKDFF